RVEKVKPAHVVVARTFDEVIQDVEAVDPAREQRPAERSPEREQVVGFRPARVGHPDALYGRCGRCRGRGCCRHGAENNPRLASLLVVDVWTNWGRNQTCAAEAVDHPADEGELAAAVKAAAAA